MADLMPWEEAAPPPSDVPLGQNPWEEPVGVQTAGPNAAGQIPISVGAGAPIAPESWNPFTVPNAKQAVADLIRGASSTWNLGGDLGVKAGNALFNQHRPLPSQEQEAWLQKTFGQPDTSTAGNVGNMVATMFGGLADPMARAMQIQRVAGVPNAAGDAANAVRNRILSDAQAINMKVPPNYVGAGAGSRALGYIGGNDALAAQMSTKNAANYDVLGRQVAGLTPQANLTPDVLNARISDIVRQTYAPFENLNATIVNGPNHAFDMQQAAAPFIKAEQFAPGSGDQRIANLYNQYANLRANSSGLTQTLTNLRADADAAYRAGDTQLGSARRGVAQAIENSVQANLQNPLSPISVRLKAQGVQSADTLNDYLAGRRQIAQAAAIRDALTPDGHIDPQILGNNLNPSWTGPLKTMGEFAATAPPLARYTGAPPKTIIGTTKPEQGVITGAIGGALMGHPSGYMAAAAGGAAARALTRQALMTKMYQQLLVHPTSGILANPALQNVVPAVIQNSGLFGQK